MAETLTPTAKPSLSKKDFETDQDVRWCPGCGDYSILAAVQKHLPSIGIPPERTVFVSGIGCSSRFPYYMSTYGFHTIHGRAPGFATGIKLTNPELSVWVVTGDGDALSIGGNHFIHLLRRNVDLNILLFNNRIYGLTKGQYSPTSEVGKVTKSSPHGSADFPLSPVLVALGAKASFVARAIERDAAQLGEMLDEASRHRGTSFLEIYQNCNIFNDGAFEYVADRANRAETQLVLRHGKPLVFGKDRTKAIKFDNFVPQVITLTEAGDDAALKAGAAIYDRHNAALANAVARLDHPDFPVPMGVFYQEQRETFDDSVGKQNRRFLDSSPKGGSASKEVNAALSELFAASETWLVS